MACKAMLPLLLVSGRRLTEIASPRSTFTPVPHTHAAAFAGALKKRGRTPTFIIPLLVPPLLYVLTRLQIDRRLVACVLTFGLITPYMFLPVGFGNIFLNEIFF